MDSPPASSAMGPWRRGGAFPVASLLALLALVTLMAKSLLEWRNAAEIKATRHY